MEFHCVQDCSQCCIDREYFPSKEYGKIGVLILPEEKQRIEKMAREKGVSISIVPRIGVSDSEKGGPTQVIAYQMMGREDNGNTCPFLDVESDDRAGHGGYMCRIYQDRPLACSAYPLVETDPIALDAKCKFCMENGSADGNLNSEAESLLKIKSKMSAGTGAVWRYATGVGNDEDRGIIKRGWIRDD